MLQKVLIFALLFGIASCLPYKQELLNSLSQYETQLKTAKVEAAAHGFNIYQSGFDILLVKVEKLIAHANGLKDNADVYDDMEFYKLSTDLHHQIDAAIKSPFPREHLKANALYLWATLQWSKDFAGALRLNDAVKAIVEKEYLVSTSLEGSGDWKAQSKSLDEMYSALEKSLENEYVPSFESHWHLINKTQEYMKTVDSKLPLYEQIRTALGRFRDLTISMAQQFPIHSKEESVDVYKQACGAHIIAREELKKLIHVVSQKENYVNRLAAFKGQVSAAIEKFQTQGKIYYANELKETLNQIQHALDEARQLPEDVKTDNDLENKIRGFEREVPTMLVNPAPTVATKAKALYLAASKIYTSPSTLVDAVQDFIEFAAYYATTSTGPSAYLTGRYRTEADTRNYHQKYDLIIELISGFEAPTQADFEKVIKALRERVHKFEASSMKTEAKNLADKLDAFVIQTREMNGELPLRSKESAEKYSKIAAAQYETYKTLEKMLAEHEPEEKHKQNLYLRLEQGEKQLLSAMEKYERRGANAYALILKEIQIKVQVARQLLEKEPVEKMVIAVNNLEDMIASRVANPNPNAQMKADALYLAAMKVKSDPTGSLILTQQVNNIVRFESTITGMTDKVQLQSSYSQRDLKYTTLENFLKGSVVVTMDDSEKLAESATFKVKELKNQNRKQEAEALEKEISQMGKFRMIMGALLPIANEPAVDDYYGHALHHQIAYVNIQKLMK